MSRPEDSLSDLKAMQERMNALLEESLSRDPDAREELAKFVIAVGAKRWLRAQLVGQVSGSVLQMMT